MPKRPAFLFILEHHRHQILRTRPGIRSYSEPACYRRLTRAGRNPRKPEPPRTDAGAGGAGQAGGGKVAMNANLASFAADTASKSAKSVRTVVRDATRAKALGADLDRVEGNLGRIFKSSTGNHFVRQSR